jgi:hypothetical protein
LQSWPISIAGRYRYPQKAEALHPWKKQTIAG